MRPAGAFFLRRRRTLCQESKSKQNIKDQRRHRLLNPNAYRFYADARVCNTIHIMRGGERKRKRRPKRDVLQKRERTCHGERAADVQQRAASLKPLCRAQRHFFHAARLEAQIDIHNRRRGVQPREQPQPPAVRRQFANADPIRGGRGERQSSRADQLDAELSFLALCDEPELPRQYDGGGNAQPQQKRVTAPNENYEQQRGDDARSAERQQRGLCVAPRAPTRQRLDQQCQRLPRDITCQRQQKQRNQIRVRLRGGKRAKQKRTEQQKPSAVFGRQNINFQPFCKWHFGLDGLVAARAGCAARNVIEIKRLGWHSSPL